jgi:hypothetical protein
LPDPIKKKRRREKAGETQSGAGQNAERMPALSDVPGSLAQTGGAEDAVVMFGDALAAKEVAALRALRDGFARGMIEAMLMDQG